MNSQKMLEAPASCRHPNSNQYRKNKEQQKSDFSRSHQSFRRCGIKYLQRGKEMWKGVCLLFRVARIASARAGSGWAIPPQSTMSPESFQSLFICYACREQACPEEPMWFLPLVESPGHIWYPAARKYLRCENRGPPHIPRRRRPCRIR